MGTEDPVSTRWRYAPVVAEGDVWNKFIGRYELEEWGVPSALMLRWERTGSFGPSWRLFLASVPPVLLGDVSGELSGMHRMLPVEATAAWAEVSAEVGDDPAAVGAWVRRQVGEPPQPPSAHRDLLSFELPGGRLGSPFSRVTPPTVGLVVRSPVELVDRGAELAEWLGEAYQELLAPLIEANAGRGYAADHNGKAPAYGLGGGIFAASLDGKHATGGLDEASWRRLRGRVSRGGLQQVSAVLQPVNGSKFDSKRRGRATVNVWLKRVTGRPTHDSVMSCGVSLPMAEALGVDQVQDALVALGGDFIARFGVTAGFIAITPEWGIDGEQLIDQAPVVGWGTWLSPKTTALLGGLDNLREITHAAVHPAPAEQHTAAWLQLPDAITDVTAEQLQTLARVLR